MTLKNNRAPLLCCFKLCASFHSHQLMQTKVTVQKRLVRVKIGNFLSRVALKFDGWPLETIGHLFYATSSFVHHFKVIGEFKLELQTGNAPFGSKSAIFCPVWPWNLMDDLEKQYCTSSMLLQAMCIIWKLLMNSNWSYSPEMLNLSQNQWFFVLRDLEIWWLTFKNNRASLLCCFKLCASFHCHQWIQTKVTFRKRSIREEISDFLSCVTLKFDRWPWKTTGHLFYVASSFLHHYIAIGEFKLELQSRNSPFGSKSVLFCPLWSCNLTDDLEK